MKLAVILALLAVSAASVSSAAPIKIPFWHSMESASGLVQKYADDFNKSQSQYEVVPTSVGNYREAPAKLQAAIKAGSAPVLYQAELSYFPKLVADGQLANLDKLEAGLPPEVVKDFYPAVWNYGDYAGKRYGLPWNVSTPVLYYNTVAFRRAGVGAPKTWAEVESTAKKLSGRGKRGLLIVADAWSFEQMVAARGGSVVQGGKPNFTGPEAVAALEQLARMVQNNSAQPRSLDEATRAALDFVRGANLMAIASVANWTDFAKYSLFFELGAAPMPCDVKCAVPIGGAELVVLRDATPQEQAGAFAFWKFLTEPGRLQDWVQQTAYMSPRRSVQPLLAGYYAQNPYRKAAYDQLEVAVPRPRLPEYADWQKYLEEAIQKAITGQQPARAALEEAQRKAGK